jgi:hypothetical protein
MFQLKKISAESIPEALEKAERYRLLNEPRLAESICMDILEVEPSNNKAIIILMLSITDEFDQPSSADVNDAKKLLGRLPGEYERNYYGGIICERKGKSLLGRNIPDGGYIIYEWMMDAMEYYEKAEKLRPPGNDDALLRWNTCARLIMRYHLKPRGEKYIEPQLE